MIIQFKVRPNWQQIVLFRPQVVITGDSGVEQRVMTVMTDQLLLPVCHDNHEHVMHNIHDITHKHRFLRKQLNPSA